MTGRGRPRPGCRRGGLVRRGATLAEVVVAVALLEVGLTAAAGTLLLAARTLGDARLRERAAAHVSALADSLLATPGAAAGEVPGPGYRIGWRRDGGGWRLTGVAGADTLVDVAVPWAP